VSENQGAGGDSRPHFQPSRRRFDMLFAMTEREFYDRFGDWPFLILFLVICWAIGFVKNHPDEVEEAMDRAFGAIRRLFKNNGGK
jgi:hypothetical protein